MASTVTQEQLQELVIKGKIIYDNAVLSINRDGDTFKQLPDLAPNYKIVLEHSSKASLEGCYETSLKQLGHPVTNCILAVVENTVKFVPEKEPPYQNYIHADGKAILCMNNLAKNDQLFGRPHRLFWSDLMAACFSQTMTAYGGGSEGLEAIWRIQIVNLFTKAVISAVCRGQSVELGPGDDGFYALLATEHGKGPARMLAAYPQMFGRRFMTRVWVFQYGGSCPSICWILDKLPHPEPQLPPLPPNRPMSKKEERKYKKMLARSSSSSDGVN